MNHAVIRRALTFLDARRFSFLIRARFKAVCRDLYAGEQLQLAFCDWMSHVESLGDGSVQDRVLDYCDKEFWDEFAHHLSTAPRGEWPAITVCFAGDQRYVLLERRMKWYDIYEGQLLDELPKRPVTLLICDLTALWADTLDRMGGGTHDPGQKSEASERAGSDSQGVGRPG